MANEKRLIALDYNAIRAAFDEEFKATMELIRSGETHLDNLAEGFTEADRVLRKMLTVDAVEVVRCKDCQYGNSNYPVQDGQCVCEYYDFIIRNHDDFCSRGERWCE